MTTVYFVNKGFKTIAVLYIRLLFAARKHILFEAFKQVFPHCENHWWEKKKFPKFFPNRHEEIGIKYFENFFFPIDMNKSETNFVKASNFVFRFVHVNLKKLFWKLQFFSDYFILCQFEENCKNFFSNLCMSIGKIVNFFPIYLCLSGKNVFEQIFSDFFMSIWIIFSSNAYFEWQWILSGNDTHNLMDQPIMANGVWSTRSLNKCD